MFTLSPMTLDDLPEVDRVQRASFIPELWEDMSLFEGILKAYAQGGFVARKDGTMVGYLLAHPTRIDRDDFEAGCKALTGREDYLFIHDLCVGPAVRGLGVAGLLLGRLEDFARENGFSRYCGIAVQGTESFWLKQGFSPVRPYSYRGESGFLMVKE